MGFHVVPFTTMSLGLPSHSDVSFFEIDLAEA